MTTTILFDIGGTLVHADPPATPLGELVARPVDVAVRSLRALATRYRLGAVTDTAVMTSAQVRAALGDTGLAELLEVIVTSADVGAAKPDPRGILAALAALSTGPGETLFVGDADADAGAARAAGVRFAPTGPQHDPGLAVRAAIAAEAGTYAAAAALVGPVDEDAAGGARAHHDRL
ncbi:MAG: HAD family hydrolase, partial [Mycobacteriales bacterium]